MITLTPGQIFLADSRTLDENNIYRRFSSFENCCEAKAELEKLNTLTVFNDDLLAAGKTAKIEIRQSGYLVLIPITGALICDGVDVDVEEAWIKPVVAGQTVVLNNPYTAHRINYLIVQIAVEHYANHADWKIGFDLSKNTNKMVKLTNTMLPFGLHIGRFDGRSEALHRIKEGALLYAFVIDGAFELQGRLLHQRDGLTLWDVNEADLESLSNGAVILLVDLPQH